MSELATWTEADLQRLVDNKAQESLTLDYKRLAVLMNRDEISKDVSAFANSAGGRIIYGIVEKGNLPESVDDDVSMASMTRETLENIINSTIHPEVAGLIIKPIELSTGATAFVLDIPAADLFAPHQANDKRYYRRANFKRECMEDYEVRQAFKRSQTPHLAVYVQWRQDRQWVGNDARGRLSFTIENLADEPALYSVVTLFVDKRLFHMPNVMGEVNFIVTEGLVDPGTPVWVGEKRLTVPHDFPLFRRRPRTFLTVTMPAPEVDNYVFAYRVSCPGFDDFVSASIRIDAWHISGQDEGGRRMLSNTLLTAASTKQ